MLILENALYFVITPESCAAIMWRDANQKQLAAEAMRISAPEVAGWAVWTRSSASHRAARMLTPNRRAASLAGSLKRHLAELKSMPIDELIARGSRNSATSPSSIRKVSSWLVGDEAV